MWMEWTSFIGLTLALPEPEQSPIFGSKLLVNVGGVWCWDRHVALVEVLGREQLQLKEGIRGPRGEESHLCFWDVSVSLTRQGYTANSASQTRDPFCTKGKPENVQKCLPSLHPTCKNPLLFHWQYTSLLNSCALSCKHLAAPTMLRPG